MQSAAVILASSLAHPTDVLPDIRTSINNYALEVIPSVDSGVSLWGGDVVFRGNPPPALENSTIHQSWGLAAPEGAPLRIVCNNPPCDVHISSYNNRCDAEEKQNSLLGQLDAAGWSSLGCTLFSETTTDGTEVRLPIKYKRLTEEITEFPLSGSTSRVLIFVKEVSAGAAPGDECPPINHGPNPTPQECPGLPIFPENTIQPESIARVVQVLQDGVFVSEDTEQFVGLDTVNDLLSADQWGNVKSGFELDQASVISFYQQADSEAVSLVWTSGKDERATRQGDRQKLTATVTGFSPSSLKYASDLSPTTFSGNVATINADWPIERSVASVFETTVDCTAPQDITISISHYDLVHGLYLRTPGGLSPIDTSKPFTVRYDCL